MSFKSWGNYPVVDMSAYPFSHANELKEIIAKHQELICYGNGRSYGDSALNKEIIQTKDHHYFLNFDQEKGILHCQSGILLSEIIDSFLPYGYFLEVTPGTQYITLGGAIAADVHGKNHHKVGSFSESVLEFNLMLADGQIVCCSSGKNIDLFRATCGGMGLTGIILDAKISLKPIVSDQINQTTLKTDNLKETFDAFEENKEVSYSVAWIDCLAKGDNLGRSLLMLGEHAKEGELRNSASLQWEIPFNLPSFTLNSLTVKAFNTLYYNKQQKKQGQQTLHLEQFFYPLDSINKWNRMYGKKGFLQYQFVLPLESSYAGMKKILNCISASGKGSFLSVLKRLGKENSNWLSFPREGYTLALDFKLEAGLFTLLSTLDNIVLEFGGRIYLAKDARVSKSMFESGYPHIEKFRNLRHQYQMDKKFNSLQSIRIGI